jgi:hypothetical protein
MQALNAGPAAALELPAVELPAAELELPPELDLLPHATKVSAAAAATTTIFVVRDTCKTHLPLRSVMTRLPKQQPRARPRPPRTPGEAGGAGYFCLIAST